MRQLGFELGTLPAFTWYEDAKSLGQLDFDLGTLPPAFTGGVSLLGLFVKSLGQERPSSQGRTLVSDDLNLANRDSSQGIFAAAICNKKHS